MPTPTFQSNITTSQMTTFPPGAREPQNLYSIPTYYCLIAILKANMAVVTTCTTRTYQRTVGYPTGGSTVWPAMIEIECYVIYGAAPTATNDRSLTLTGTIGSSLTATPLIGQVKNAATNDEVSIQSVLLPAIVLAGAAVFL